MIKPGVWNNKSKVNASCVKLLKGFFPVKHTHTHTHEFKMWGPSLNEVRVVGLGRVKVFLCVFNMLFPRCGGLNGMPLHSIVMGMWMLDPQ